MADVKDAIEEMIEESYLLGLSEEEILTDFSRFIDTCYTVIQDNVKSREALSRLAENLAREKTSTRIADHSTAQGKVAAKDAQRACAEKAARRKRMVLKAIADYDPHLVRLINEQRFQVDIKEVERPKLKVSQRPRLGALRPALAPGWLHHCNRAHPVPRLPKALGQYELIETCSPGPFIESFARGLQQDWFGWRLGRCALGPLAVPCGNHSPIGPVVPPFVRALRIH